MLAIATGAATVLIFIMVLSIVAALLTVAAATMISHVMRHPPRMTDARAVRLLGRLSPGDLSLPFTPLSIRVEDRQTGRPLDLAAWWVPADAPSDRCIVLVHGYADAKVGAIAWAPFLRTLGFHVVALDLRGHGESGGKSISGGWWERWDLAQAIDRVRELYPLQTKKIILYGLSFGGLVAAATAALGNDVAGVLLDCPPRSPVRAARLHADLLGMGGPFLQRLAVHISQWQVGADWSELAVPRIIQKITCPLMLVACGRDVFVPAEDREAFEEAIAARRATGLSTEYLLVQESEHLLGMQSDPARYAAEVGEFLVRL